MPIKSQPIKFQPRAGDVVMCDFTGFVEPEMVKTRPVVVIAQHKRNKKLVTVVPLSTTKPAQLENYHHEMSTNPLPDKPHTSCWAKCDMIYTVALARLDRYRVGGNQYIVPKVSKADFKEIRAAVAAALYLFDN